MGRSEGHGLLRSGAAIVVRPWLWSTAARQILVLARPGWWRRWPPLPEPEPAYLAFRLQTQYGDAGHPASPRDLVSYLAWVRQMRRAGW